MHDDRADLPDTQHQTVGLGGAVAIGIGGMVGGGIFAVLGVAATKAGGATPIAFLIGGLVAALTAASYSKLSVAFPSAGGTVAFVDRVFGIGELTGSLNMVLWAGYIATTALYADAFGNYTATLLPYGSNPPALLVPGLTVVGLAIPWIINLTNASLVARTETWIVGVKLIILLGVIGAGTPAVRMTTLAPDTWKSPGAIIGAGMLIFVAYEGFELIANASADATNPSRTLPRAFGLSIGIVIVLYVLVAGVVAGSLSADQIAGSAEFALAEAASVTLGSMGFNLVAISAMLATLSAINATLYGAARLSFTLATEGELPQGFRRLTWNQPIGLHVTAGLGAFIAVALPLASISAVASSIFLLVFAVINVAAVRAAAETGGSRLVSGAGAVGCAASLVVLLVQTARTDHVAMTVLGILIVAALIAERMTIWRVHARRFPPT